MRLLLLWREDLHLVCVCVCNRASSYALELVYVIYLSTQEIVSSGRKSREG